MRVIKVDNSTHSDRLRALFDYDWYHGGAAYIYVEIMAQQAFDINRFGLICRGTRPKW